MKTVKYQSELIPAREQWAGIHIGDVVEVVNHAGQSLMCIRKHTNCLDCIFHRLGCDNYCGFSCQSAVALEDAL